MSLTSAACRHSRECCRGTPRHSRPPARRAMASRYDTTSHRRSLRRAPGCPRDRGSSPPLFPTRKSRREILKSAQINVFDRLAMIPRTHASAASPRVPGIFVDDRITRGRPNYPQFCFRRMWGQISPRRSRWRFKRGGDRTQELRSAEAALQLRIPRSSPIRFV